MAPTFTRILVATDFGVESTAAFHAALSLARALGASIHLLHVAKDPFLAVSTPELYGLHWTPVRDDLTNQGQARLAWLVERSGDVPVACDVRIGRAAETIVQAADDVDADLIVMGTHGRGALGHLLLGSVAEQVIRLAGCPVMTVREFGAVRIASREQVRADHESAAHVLA